MKFLFPVQADFLERADLSAKLLEIFQKEMPDEELLKQQKTMVAFGLLPPDLDLKKTMLDLLTEQIAGFYDPDTKRLYLIREGGPEEKRLWWEKLLGTGNSFDPDEQKTILIHEMSHALMDQHHDLLSMMSSVDAGSFDEAHLEVSLDGDLRECSGAPSQLQRVDLGTGLHARKRRALVGVRHGLPAR